MHRKRTSNTANDELNKAYERAKKKVYWCSQPASPTGIEDYTVYPQGGKSWATPYVAGLYVLECQVKPDITYDEFWKLAVDTSRSSTGQYDGKSYEAKYIVDPVKIIEELKK